MSLFMRLAQSCGLIKSFARSLRQMSCGKARAAMGKHEVELITSKRLG